MEKVSCNIAFTLKCVLFLAEICILEYFKADSGDIPFCSLITIEHYYYCYYYYCHMYEQINFFLLI